ncbi:hypothetical protein DFJ73DRAFT_785608 [Zopfochytrium polystomum]|nr:hypothetical protein DFJ73DRAFT_785608 [Zopfochytrium polystomum]
MDPAIFPGSLGNWKFLFVFFFVFAVFCSCASRRTRHTSPAVAHLLICGYIHDPTDRYRVATLLRFERTQATFLCVLVGDIFTRASRTNNVELLSLLHRNGQIVGTHTPHRVMIEASAGGSVAALQWWKDTGLEFSCSEEAIVAASKNGHVGVLE